MASCAAQNAALVVLPASLQVVGAERLERGALADNLHDDLQLSRRLSDAPVVFTAWGQILDPDWSKRNTSRGGVFSPVFPLDTLIVVATMVGAVLA